MNASKQSSKTSHSLLLLGLLILGSGCTSTTQFPEPVSMSVAAQIEQIEVGKTGLLFRVGCAFEDAVANPATRVGDMVAVGTLAAVSESTDPYAGVAAIPFMCVALPTALAERGATFVGKLGSLEKYSRDTTLAERQLLQAAQQADVAGMFGEHMPISEAGNLQVIVRSVTTEARSSGSAALVVTAEVVRPASDGSEQVLKSYVHRAVYRAEHPDLVAKRGTPTRAIQAGIAAIAAEICGNFNIAPIAALAQRGE
jgi:hypothetical protein